ncbi:MAG: amidohydrolase [Lachnospiraceae bacterium]|nr:amidohydrolase [Lachnospiraceae bacterium]
MSLPEEARAMHDHLIEIRRQLHAHPELGGQETETSRLIAEELRRIGGYEIRENAGQLTGGHGVIADIRGEAGDGPCIALRADMDALEIEEETGLAFSSENKGIMHACGHDHHVTMLLGAAKLIKDHIHEIKGNVRLIFQPAEECVPTGGALALIREGILDDVDAIFGLHVWPTLPENVLGVKAGPQMASADHFYIRIHGESAHGAMPDKGKDALLAGASLVQALQSIVSRNISPIDSAIVTVGIFEAGHQWNIIPGECYLEGTCRTFDEGIRDTVEDRMRALVEQISAAYGCRGELVFERGHEPLINDKTMADYMRSTYRELYGEEMGIDLDAPAMTGEDFARYLSLKPGAFGWLGTTKKDGEFHPLHSSHFAGNEDVLPRGAALLTALVLNFRG